MTDANPFDNDPRSAEKQTVANDAAAGEPVEGEVQPDPDTLAETQDESAPEFAVDEDGEIEPLADNPKLYEHADDDVVLGTDAVDSRADESVYPPISDVDDREPSDDDQ